MYARELIPFQDRTLYLYVVIKMVNVVGYDAFMEGLLHARPLLMEAFPLSKGEV